MNMQNTYSKNDRLAALRLLLTQNEMSSQEEVIQALARQHIEVTQSTLSRDFKRLKVAKAATMGGSYIYVLPNDTMYKRISTPGSVREMMQEPGFQSINFSGNMGVIKTRPGYASAIAWNIDKADLPQIIGTIAGDDTIFIVIKEGFTQQSVIEALSVVIANIRQPR
jgi:transcriptional regulator of arginine metabolism